MAFPGQKTLHGELVSLEPITGDPAVAYAVSVVAKKNGDVLAKQLPDIAKNYSSQKRVQRRHSRLFKREDGEGFVVRDQRSGKFGGAIIGQVSVIQQPGIVGVGEWSALLDYWIFPEGERRPVGLEVAKLAIVRGFEVFGGTPPHAILYEDESVEPSVEFKEFMYPVADVFPGIGPGHPDWTGVSGRVVSTYVARPLTDYK